jgi:1,4-dihydroxy-2-naphthoyl-CoA hydrolase
MTDPLPRQENGLVWAARRGMGALAEKLGMEFVEFSLERCVATLPVEGNTQPVGLMHGGAYVVLAESLGSMAANLHAGPGRDDGCPRSASRT